MLRLLIIILYILSTAGFIQAQDDYTVRHFTVKHGLLSNKGIQVCKDGRGYHWVGSEKGLQRFDGYTFRTFPVEDTDSLPLHYIVYQLRAVGDSLLVAATSIGLLQYSYHTDQLRIIPLQVQGVHCAARQVYPLSDSILLVGYANNMGLYRFSVKRKTLEPLHGKAGDNFRGKSVFIIMDGPEKSVLIDNKGEYTLYDYAEERTETLDRSAVPSRTKMYYSHRDKQGNVWFSSEEGVFVMRKGERNLLRITDLDAYIKPELQLGRNIMPRNDSTIYVCIDWQGVFVLNTNTYTVQSVIRKDDYQLNELISNSFSSIYSANDDALWISGDGLYLLQPLADGASFFSMSEIYKDLPTNILSLYEDWDGAIWIGTDGSGLHRYDVEKRAFSRYFKSKPHSSTSAPSSNVILSMLGDKDRKRLWIGTYNGGLCWYDYATQEFGNSPMDEQKGILSNNVWTLASDADGQLLASFHCRSLARKNKTGNWQNAQVNNNGIACECIVRLLTDTQGRTWIGYSGCGIDLLDNQSFAASNKVQRTPDNVEALADDGSFLWVGTLDGLKLFDKDAMRYARSPLSQQIGQQKVNALLVDSRDRLWIAADDKLYVSDSLKNSLVLSSLNKYFDGSDIMAMIESRNGELIIGGKAGLLIIPVDKAAEPRPTDFRINISEIRLFKEPVTLASIRGTYSYETLKSLELAYYENYIGFSFSALQITLNDALTYSCWLEGLDSYWQEIDEGENRVEYANLQPGIYTLHIRASLQDDPSVFQTRQLKIVIKPPLWKNNWLRLTLALLFVGGIVAWYFVRIRQMKLRQEQLERAIDDRTRELRERNAEIATQAETLEDQYLSLKEKQKELEVSNDELQRSNATKNRLFSIVAHDLRSPFSGLAGITKIMIDRFEQLTQDKIRSYIEASYESIISIQSLLENLLQWSQSQSDDIVLYWEAVDLQQMIAETCSPLEMSSRNKNISLFIDNLPSATLWVDKITISTVIRNIVQNAIKFTPQHGVISITAEQIASNLAITITDSGFGIPQEVVESLENTTCKIDSRQGTEGETGTGLGLSMCADFVRKNKGKLTFTPLAEGTSITIILPLAAENKTISTASEQAHTPAEYLIDCSLLNNKIVLIVDDNAMIREHLSSILSPHCTVLEAHNGQEGIEAAMKQIPDLVISDVAMPVADGFELCRQLAAAPATCHIPVFLLTAKTANIARIEGLQQGAADYITKPFSEQELLLKLCNNLKLRANIQKHLQAALSQEPAQTDQPEIADPVLRKLQELIALHYANPELSVEMLSSEMAMSKMTLYRKLKSLVDISPNEMINDYRLQKGRELLLSQKLTVAEAAYASGFNDPKYFSRKFKERFGKSPSEMG
jgi:signal transduction histidine kinase/DNA-binding response OmpR family regulator/ligand-binding sensor domain-containing protein